MERAHKPLKIGVVGCGVISDIYLQTLSRFDVVEVAAISSLDIRATRQKAGQYAIAKACSLEEIFADPAIDLVLNLTIPSAHAAISLAALNAGKHVYSPKSARNFAAYEPYVDFRLKRHINGAASGA